MHFTPIIDECVLQNHALGQIEGEAGRLITEGKEAQLAAQLAVVTALCFFDALDVFLQHTALGECTAVDAGKHLILFAAPPIGAGAAHELNRFNGTGRHQMRAGAKIGKIALTVKNNVLAFTGVLLDQFQLIRLICHQAAGFINSQLKAYQRQILFHDLCHLGFQLFQILGSKGRLYIKIVVKAVLNGRTDGELSLREQMLYCLRQDMAGGVVECPLPILLVKGEDLQSAILIQNGTQVGALAIHQSSTGVAIQPHADLLCQFCYGNRGFRLTDGAVFQGNADHISYSSIMKLLFFPNKKAAPFAYRKRNSRGEAHCPTVPPEFARLRRASSWAITVPCRRCYTP